MTWINLLMLIVAFCAMEGLAWFAHKYLMHGPLWFLHKDHHQSNSTLLEWNDVFLLLFAAPSWLLIMYGLMDSLLDWKVFVGAGVALYGIAYFLLHEVFVHQRIKWLSSIRVDYFKRLKKAHLTHHKTKTKKGGSCYGMLVFPKIQGKQEAL